MFARGIRKEKATEQPKTHSVVAWSISFENLLNDPDGVSTFKAFLKQEFSAENIEFWIACRDYSKLTDPYEKQRRAREIYDQHLRLGAPDSVNINCQTRDQVFSQMKNPTPDLFADAQKEIFILMKFDCYLRFLKSKLYVRTLNAEKMGQPLPCSCLSVSKSPTCARYRSKSREKNRASSSKKANSASFASSSNNDANATDDGANKTPTRKSFFTYKKDMDAVWNRLQNRMDDQRGMELSCDMPKFLLH